MIYFTADTHFSHKNIIHSLTEWKQGSMRDYDSIESMNNHIIDTINQKVQPDDVLYHLGDWSFGNFTNIYLREKIKCKNIHLILGNHDHHIKNNKNNVQNLFSSISTYLEITYNKQLICLCHYPMRDWNQKYHGSLHLYGHTHGMLPNYEKSMDVGVDTNNMQPYTINEILEKLQ